MMKAQLNVDLSRAGATVNPRLFGSFVEHLGRCVYSGIYEPGHPTADENGFRGDVMGLVKELGVTTVRYPGGNFVSGYRWEDGVGPDRPRRLDLAWHSTETNQFGLDEFMAWAEECGIEPMMAVNLGTRGLEEALDLLEYTNVPAGTAIADQRAANGHPEPYGVAMWCLGNEMDGPWQLGHRDAASYGELAARVGAGMLQIDPNLELVVCGSSNSSMPTFGAWEKDVLRRTWDSVSHISCHAYYEEKDGDIQSFLASAVDMDQFIATVAGVIDEVAAEKAAGAPGGQKKVAISFDEWNVWYQRHWESDEKITGATDPWPVAPRLLENAYSVADAVVVGNLLISLVRRADVVTSASMAQLVNAIAPIMTEPGGSAWRQTTFYPFAVAAELACGEVAQCAVDSPVLATAEYGEVAAVDAIATVDRQAGRGLIMAVNRSVSDEAVVELDPALNITRVRVLSDPNPYAANTLDDPERVVLTDVALGELPAGGAQLAGSALHLPAVSWAAIEFAL
ncbi:MAG: arabinosylfuranosidase ArfA [Ancrocorticia sp.]|uniref:arabinosylfuranosidase ArfA n=1 Tax=Ancrocorticia sp. TaxID=2593684 RepID=UPI003F8F4FD0